MTIRESIQLFLKICDAVNYAQQRGVIHRDLKPSNILVDLDQQPRVLDFGLAKSYETDLQETANLSATGQVMGTLAYMSPEQASGRTNEVDTRSDVYSLGVVLYELLTGVLPYELDRTLAENLSTISTQEPNKRLLKTSRIGNELSTIILKSLHKEQDRRYQSAGEMGSDISRYLEGQPIAARRDSTLYIVRKMLRRNLVATLAAFSFLLLVLVSAVVAWGLYFSAEEARMSEARATAEAIHQRDLAHKIRDQNIESLYAAEMNLGSQAANQAGGHVRVAALTEKWIPTSSDMDYRAWEWYYLRSLVHRESHVIELTNRATRVQFNHKADKLAVAMEGELLIYDPETWKVDQRFATEAGSFASMSWCPNDRYIACASEQSALVILDVDSKSELLQVRDTKLGQFTSVAWNASGTRLIVGTDQGYLTLWDVESKSALSEDRLSTNIRALDWHPQQPILAIGCVDRAVRLWHTDRRELVAEKFADSDWVSDVKWDSKGSRLATVSIGGATSIYSGLDLQPVWRHENNGQLDDVCWSPDDSQLATASRDRTIRLWDLATGKLLRRLNGHTDFVSSIDWRSTGIQLASVGRDKTLRVWSAKLEDQDRVIWDDQMYRTEFVAWNPNGSSVAVCGNDNNIELHDPETGSVSQVLRRHTKFCTALSWNPSGNLLASGSRDQTVVIWEASSGAVKLQFLGHRQAHQGQTNIVHALCWSPDGKYVVSGSHAGRIFVWQPQNGEVVTEFNEHRAIVQCVHWHPTSELVISSSHIGKILIWEPLTGKTVAELSVGDRPILAVCWSPDGQLFAAASDEGIVRIWDANTRHLVREFNGHRGRTNELRWSPVGQRLASCSDDGTVKVWSPRADAELLTLDVYARELQSTGAKVVWSLD
ncbi:MAG: protein kinase, partial [Planctomycetales bacterium]|nr:protein kinase [Planctomycetales bacterium]